MTTQTVYHFTEADFEALVNRFALKALEIVKGQNKTTAKTELLTVKDVAKQLRRSEKCVRAMIERGDLPAVPL